MRIRTLVRSLSSLASGRSADPNRPGRCCTAVAHNAARHQPGDLHRDQPRRRWGMRIRTLVRSLSSLASGRSADPNRPGRCCTAAGSDRARRRRGKLAHTRRCRALRRPWPNRRWGVVVGRCWPGGRPGNAGLSTAASRIRPSTPTARKASPHPTVPRAASAMAEPAMGRRQAGRRRVLAGACWARWWAHSETVVEFMLSDKRYANPLPGRPAAIAYHDLAHTCAKLDDGASWRAPAGPVGGRTRRRSWSSCSPTSGASWRPVRST